MLISPVHIDVTGTTKWRVLASKCVTGMRCRYRSCSLCMKIQLYGGFTQPSIKTLFRYLIQSCAGHGKVDEDKITIIGPIINALFLFVCFNGPICQNLATA